MKKLSRFAKLALTLATVATLSGVTVIGLVGCKDDDTPPNGAVQAQPVKVTVEKGAGGNVTTDSDSYVAGDDVYLTITPDTGYELDTVKIGGVDKTHLVRSGMLTLENVSEDVTVAVAFKARTASAVSYNIINNQGGTASLSASNAYVGDRVTLTVTPENGYEVMTVKVNGGANLANSLVGNTVGIELTAETVEIEIEFYAFPVTATLVCNNGGTAQITAPKDVYSVGDTIEVTVTPNDGYVLQSLAVNGEDKTDEVVENKLTLTVERVGNINIAVAFDVKPAHVEFEINATKYGNEYDLNGTSVVLKHENGRKYSDIAVVGGKITANVIPGKYKVTIQDFTACEITVGEQGYTTAVSTIYQPFKDSAAWNISGIANGTVTINTDYGHLYLKEDLGDFIATYKIKKMGAGNRMSLGVKHGNKVMGFSSDLSADNPGVWLPNSKDWDNNPWGNANYISNAPDDWFGFTADEQEAYKGDGIDITVARSGSRLYLFFGERYVTSWELFGSTDSVALAFTGWYPVGHSLPVTISAVEEDITALVESTVTATANGGTATLDKEDGKYGLGETVTVTLSPNEAQENQKCVLESLTLDSEPVELSKVVDGVFAFTATQKAHSVSATFKTVAIADINVAITAEKFGVAQEITSVTLSNASYNKTHTLDNGNLVVEGLAEGSYSVSAEGYIPVEITVAGSGSTQSAKLVYNPFNPSENWNVSEYGNGKLTNTEFGHLVMKDEFDSFAFSIKLKKTSVRTSINVKFGDKMIGFSNDGNSAGLWLPDSDWGNIPWENVSYQSVNTDWYGNESFNGAYEADGVTYKYVKSGDALYLFVEDTFVASWTVAGKATLGITGWGSGELAVSVSTDAEAIPGYVSGAVTASATHGTATLDGGEASKTYKLGEIVNVTLTPETATSESKKYVLESLTVDGNPVDISNVDGAYSFTATKKNHAVVATFKEVDLTVSLNIAVTAEKHGVSQAITSVTLSNNAGYNQTHTLTGDSLQVSGLDNATYTISVDGYIPVTVTSETQSVKLVYDMFVHKDGWTISSDNGTATISNAGSYGFIDLKDGFTGNFVISGTFSHPNMDSNKWGESQAFILKVGGKVCGFQLVGSVIKTMGAWENIPNINNADTWDQYTLTEAQQNKYRDGSITFTIVREGKNIHLFLDDTLCKTMDFGDFDNNAEVGLSIAQWDGVTNVPVSVSTNADTIQQWVNKTNNG